MFLFQVEIPLPPVAVPSPVGLLPLSTAETISVDGVDHFPRAGQSQHFYGLKTDVVCANTVTSLRRETA